MARYVILPCRLSHLAELARTMRAEDRAEIEGAGFHPKHIMFTLWKESAYRRAALVDGEVAACWGDAAGTLEPEAIMWLTTAPVIERVPFAFAREARREIQRLFETRLLLHADVAADYDRSLRFWAMLGFKIGEPRPLPPFGKLYREIRLEAG